MSATNHQVRLAARPRGLPQPSNWSLTAEPVPEPGPGEFVAEILYISIDPAMRGWMNAAAGAVGSVAAQITTLKGARAIGIAGGPEKCRWLTDELGIEAAIDYRDQDVAAELRRLARTGVDVYFDNVGGEILDAVLTRLARGARIVICGAISQYNAERVRGPANYLALLVARASMTGMVVFDFADRYAQATAELASWLREGRLVSREQVVDGGVSAFPDVLLKLFAGENTGKLVLAVEPA